MTIRRRILLFQLVVAAVVVAMAALTLLHLRSTGSYVERTNWAQRQLDAATRLAVAANRYSEQIAELLLVGQPEREDFDSARAQLSAIFAELGRLTTDEMALLRASGDTVGPPQHADRLDQMRGLLREIDRSVERLLMLNQEGRQSEAVSLFRAEIENRLDAELERLISAAIAEERAEVVTAETASRRSTRQLTAGTFGALTFLLAVTLGAGIAFSRSLLPSLQALATGAAAIGRGDLEHRIVDPGSDELGLVSQRFNRMAEELRTQRTFLLEAQSELERQVAARTAELTNANCRLTDVDQQRVRLLADVSHEIRTPLTVLRGEAEVTLRGPSKTERVYREALENIASQAAEMGRLVDDLLFLARSEAEEIRFEYKTVDLRDLIAAAAEETKILADQKHIGFSLHATAPAPSVNADPRRLKQALLIVMDNAIKYSPPDTHVDVAVGRQGDSAVEIRIRDQGQGIDSGDLPHVFERFYRGDQARLTGAPGSGLGLAIARWILEKHGGGIELASAPGEGTVAQITLPARSRA